jgi:hypothetical protein
VSGADDAELARPPSIGKAAGVALGFAGLTSALVPAQILSSMTVPGPLAFVLWGMGAAGLLAIVCAFGLFRARGWAAAVGLGAALSLVGLSGRWAQWSFAAGVLHAMPLLALGSSLLALALAIVSGPAVLRSARARARLREAGLDLGA